MPGPWACGEEYIMLLPRYCPPLFFPWFWELHLGSAWASLPLWPERLSSASTNSSPREDSLHSQVHLWPQTLEDHQIQTCSSDSSHQFLTQTLKMCHRPSISTRKPSTVPQMWSICSLRHWTDSILDPVIPPPALVVGHLADPVAPTFYSFRICLLFSATPPPTTL